MKVVETTENAKRCAQLRLVSCYRFFPSDILVQTNCDSTVNINITFSTEADTEVHTTNSVI